MKSSLVSIIIPVFNGSNYLREAIDSALAQTYKHIEVLVINDGSTDDGATDKIAKSYGSKIRYFPKENGGVATALNLGIKQMKGEWFAWLSHDDIYIKNKITLMVDYLTKHPKAKILYSNYELVDAHLRHLHDVSVKPENIANMCLRLTYSYPINGCAMLINKTCFKKVGLFDPKLRTTQDYDMWFRLAKIYPYDYVPISSIKSRLHPKQGSHTYADKDEVDELLRDFIRQLPSSFLRKELGSAASSWILMVTRIYKTRGYLLSLREALKKSKEMNHETSLNYIYTKIYCAVPVSLIELVNNLRNKLESRIFGLTGAVKRFIRRIK